MNFAPRFMFAALLSLPMLSYAGGKVPSTQTCNVWRAEMQQRVQAVEASMRDADAGGAQEGLQEIGNAVYVYLAIQSPQNRLGGLSQSGFSNTPLAVDSADRVTPRLKSLERRAATLTRLGKFDEVLALWKGAITSLGELRRDNASDHAFLLNRYAMTLLSMGDSAAALPLLENATGILQPLPISESQDMLADNYSSLGVARTLQGDYGAAIKEFVAAERMLQELEASNLSPTMRPRTPEATRESKRRMAGVKLNLSVVHRALGNLPQAMSYANSALEIERQFIKMPASQAAALSNLALIHLDMGNAKQAASELAEVLKIRREALGEHHLDTLSARHNLGSVYLALGNPAAAKPVLIEALAGRVQQLGWQHPRSITSLLTLGMAYKRLHQSAQAGCAYQQAFSYVRASGEPLLEAQTNWEMALWYAENGDQNLAIYFGKLSVNLLQRLRAKASDLDALLQNSLRTQYEGKYAQLSDWLFAAGRLAEGQQVLAMLKESEYFEFTQRSATDDPRKTQASFDGKEQPWVVRYEQLSAQLPELAKEREALIKKAKTGLTPEEQSRKDVLDAELSKARQSYDAFMVELKREFTQSTAAGRSAEQRAEELGSKNLPSLRALQGTLRDLGHGAVTLHYLMTDKRLWILLTTPTIQLKREAAIGEVALNQKIAAYRAAIAARDPKINELGKALYDLLIAPVANDLKQAGAQTLMLSLDGALRYLPMAALYDGEKYLVQRYGLVIYTAASTAGLTATPKADWTLGGYGLTHAVTLGEYHFSELASVKGELEGITQNIGGAFKLDQDFTAKALQTGLESGISVVHLASHFVFKPGNETDSFLLMGDGQPLSLVAIRDIPFTDVDLLTLSACETAVGGGRDATGREVEGFGALAQNQGAKGVIATLWPVADRSTGQFMQLFYGIRQRHPGMTKAESMQRAQLAFIEGRVGPALAEVSRGMMREGAEKIEATAVTSTDHPYFWAPFILMGNWL